LFQGFNIADLLNFDPSSISGNSSDDSTASSLSTSNAVKVQLEKIVKKLETPIEELVTDCDDIREALDQIASQLPVELKLALRPTAHLGFVQEDVLSAYTRITERSNQASLRDEITAKCQEANQLKARFDDNSEQECLQKNRELFIKKKEELIKKIADLQSELSSVETAIVAADEALNNEVKIKQDTAATLKDHLIHLKSLEKKLVSGTDKADRETISRADNIRSRALEAARSHLEKLRSLNLA